LTLVSVLSPCYNSASTLNRFLDRVTKALALIDLDHEVVLVDDGSSDATWNLIKERAASDSRIRGIRLTRNFGQHPAILAGLRAARGNVVVLIDSDLDDDPLHIPLLLEPLLDGTADIALTTTTRLRKTRSTSRILHRLAQQSTGSPLVEDIGTFRAMTSPVVTALVQYQDHSSVYGPLSTQIGFRQITIEIPDSESPNSPSTYTLKKRVRLAWPMLLNEIGMPVKVTVFVAVVMFGLASTLGATAMWRFVSGGGDPTSTTSLVFLVLLLNQVLLGLGITMVAFYARGILREVLGRPRYHIWEEV